MSWLRPIAQRYGLDILIVLAAIGGMLEFLLRHDSARAPEMVVWLVLPSIALVVLPLLARRRFPFGAPAALWLLAAALSFIDGRLIVSEWGVSLAGMAAAALLGNLRDTVQARIGLAIVVGASATVVYNDPIRTPSEFIFIPALFVIAWLAGFGLRARATEAEAAEERAVLAERERDVAARIAVAEERARIARELHDVVAHAVSVMVLQVGAVRHKLPPTFEEDREALGHVEQAGRTALAEMRRLLGAMRRDGDGLDLAPQPGLENLDALADAVERAGLPVGLHVDGEPLPLPRAVDLSAYRIVQEGLTNTLKHAHASRAEVTVRYRPDEVWIEVRDDGEGGTPDGGAGHGLLGIRERVKIYGGEMDAGAGADGGFVLSARLPIDGYGQ